MEIIHKEAYSISHKKPNIDFLKIITFPIQVIILDQRVTTLRAWKLTSRQFLGLTYISNLVDLCYMNNTFVVRYSFQVLVFFFAHYFSGTEIAEMPSTTSKLAKDRLKLNENTLARATLQFKKKSHTLGLLKPKN